MSGVHEYDWLVVNLAKSMIQAANLVIGENVSEGIIFLNLTIPVRVPPENRRYTIWLFYQLHLCEWIDFGEVIAVETGSYLMRKKKNI